MKKRSSAEKTSRFEMSNAMFFTCLSCLLGYFAIQLNSGSAPNAPVRVATSEADHQTFDKKNRARTYRAAAAAPGADSSSLRPHFRSSVQVRKKVSTLDGEIVRKLETDTNLSSVCSSIRKIDRKQNVSIPGDQIMDRFQDSVFGRSSDPLFESVKPILKFAIRKPALRSLVGLTDDSNPAVNPRQYAWNKYQVLAENRQQIESILNQSYLLLMIGRSVELRPELASDLDIMTYCQDIESKLNSLSNVDFEAQKKGFNDYLKAINLKPEAIDYDPEYQTDLGLENNENTYAYNIGWIHMLWQSN